MPQRGKVLAACGNRQVKLTCDRDPSAPQLAPLVTAAKPHFVPHNAERTNQVVHLLVGVIWAWRQADAFRADEEPSDS